MGKSKRSDKEFTREQKLIKENRQLKRELAHVRKQIARLDLDRYSAIKEMVDEYKTDHNIEKTQDLLESLKETWKCRCCDNGYLEIVIFSKMGRSWYFRACNSCPNRTKSQKYTPEVKGLVKNSQ